MSRKLSLYASLVLFLSFLLVALPSAHAQSAAAGAIGGTVSDANGALLPDVTVKVTNSATGDERTVQTNKSGEFRVPELQPGVYSATVTMQGFQTLQQDLITVTVGSLSTFSPKLIVGAVTDKVEVTEEAPQLHTAGADISTTIDQNTIDNLPINGRRWSDFALLTPGVVSNSDGFGLLSFRGISYLLNNSTVDGADDNQAYFSEARGRTRSAYTVTQAAVQEFQVNTSNYSAEYGRAAGGVINTVTKSGSNKLRGEIFFYDRDNGLGGANNPYTLLSTFNQNTGVTLTPYKPKDWRKQWGFGVGGPIMKDKIFWFYAYDQSRRNFPGTSRTTDPTDLLQPATPLSGKEACNGALGNNFGAPNLTYTNPAGVVTGPFSITSNLSTAPVATKDPITGLITPSASYPVGQSYEGNFGACALAEALSPTTTGGPLNYQAAMAYYNQGLAIINSFFGPVPRTGDQVINFPKLDWQITERNRMTVQYNRLRWDSPAGVQTQSSNFYGRGSFGNDFVKADVGIFRLSTVVTNSIVNSFTAQYGRDLEIETPQPPTPNEFPIVDALPAGECSAPGGKACLARPPDVGIGGGYDGQGFDIGTNPILTRFALPDERRLQLKDDVAWVHAKHNFKFGLDYNKVSDFINNLFEGYGSYSYDFAFGFIGDYLHATTGLGGPGYANANPGAGPTVNQNYGMFTFYNQGVAIPNPKFPNDPSAGARGLLTTREYAGYATDDWRITPRLTLTLGVRYEYEYVPANPTPNIGNSNSALDVTQTQNRPDDRNNVAPRLGFALNVYGNGKTILRGGYGMYFGRIINSNILQTYQNSGGGGSQVNYSGFFSDGTVPACIPIFPAILSVAVANNCSLTSTSSSAKPNISYLSDHLQNPQVHEADIALEQDMGHGVVMGITYLSSFGRELNSSTDTNLAYTTSAIVNYAVNNTVPASNLSPYTVYPHGGKPAPLLTGSVPVRVYTGSRASGGIGSTGLPVNPNYNRILRIASNVNTNYNALAFQINKRYNNGFSLLSNFTWSHALDGNPYIGTGVPTYNTLDPNNPQEDYGNSSLDVRRRFVLALTYQPPTHFHGYKDYLLGGWRVAPLMQAQSGLPYTPFITGYPAQSASGVRGPNGSGSSSGRIEELRRNQYTRPKSTKVDLRIGKNFYFDVNKLGLERVRLEFFAEIFNIANHQNITSIQNTAYRLNYDNAGATGNNFLQFQPTFGTYTNSNSNYTYTPRQLQLAARLHF